MREFLGNGRIFDLPFMGGNVKASKLTVGQVESVKEIAKGIASGESDELDSVRYIIRASVEGASDLTDEELDSFALEEITNLAEKIIEISGLGQDKKGKVPHANSKTTK